MNHWCNARASHHSGRTTQCRRCTTGVFPHVCILFSSLLPPCSLHWVQVYWLCVAILLLAYSAAVGVSLQSQILWSRVLSVRPPPSPVAPLPRHNVAAPQPPFFLSGRKKRSIETCPRSKQNRLRAQVLAFFFFSPGAPLGCTAGDGSHCRCGAPVGTSPASGLQQPGIHLPSVHVCLEGECPVARLKVR